MEQFMLLEHFLLPLYITHEAFFAPGAFFAPALGTKIAPDPPTQITPEAKTAARAINAPRAETHAHAATKTQS